MSYCIYYNFRGIFMDEGKFEKFIGNLKHGMSGIVYVLLAIVSITFLVLGVVLEGSNIEKHTDTFLGVLLLIAGLTGENNE